MKTNVMLILLICSTILPLSASETEIQEIRQEYNAIEHHLQKGNYRVEVQRDQNDPQAGDAILYRDMHQKIRKLKCEGGSDDSAHSAAYYYRPDGTLFFSFLSAANVHGCESELRRYYDLRGRLIRQKRKDGVCRQIIGYPPEIVDPKRYFDSTCTLL